MALDMVDDSEMYSSSSSSVTSVPCDIAQHVIAVLIFWTVMGYGQGPEQWFCQYCCVFQQLIIRRICALQEHSPQNDLQYFGESELRI